MSNESGNIPKVYNKRGAKKRFVLTQEMIEKTKTLAGLGLTQEMIYSYFGWSNKTWYDVKKGSKELQKAVEEGKARTIAFVAGKLMEQVRAGNLTAIIFYLKTQAHFTEHRVIDVTPVNEMINNTIALNTTDPVEASKIYQQLMLRS